MVFKVSFAPVWDHFHILIAEPDIEPMTKRDGEP